MIFGKICLFLFYVVTTTLRHRRTGFNFSEPFLLYYVYSFNQHKKVASTMWEREREIEISKQYEMWSICLGLHHYYIYLYTCTVTLGSKIVTSTGIQLWSIKDKKGNYSHSNYAVWQCRWRWSVRRNCIVVLFYGWAFTSKWIMSFVFIVWL